MSLINSLELDVIKKQMEEACSFSLGRQLIQETNPSFDPLVIRRDQARLKEALSATILYGPMPFDGMHDITGMLKDALIGRTLSANDLLNEIRMVRAVNNIINYDKAILEPHPALYDLVQSLSYHKKTEQFIAKCINEYGEVMDNASPLLKETRKQLRNVEHEITVATNRFMQQHASSMVDNISTMRNGRVVVLVKASDKNTFGGLQYGDSSSGLASYVEPNVLVGPNNKKSQLLAQESDEVARILRECSNEVKKVAEEELGNLETVAILDALFAKAKWGEAREAIAPTLSDEKELDFRRARHPLIDEKKVVANNYHLASPQTMLLITGPNTGGKTVSMKIIGLFVLMAYSGMPVTADSAVIPYFDQVFADIGDDQSVVSSLSSFSAHVEKLADVAAHATGNSLALLDEIGSGTDPQEGESLAIAILNELRDRGTMTVATTHYSRLKAYGKRHEDILVASVQFDMEKLAPTYRYIEGLTGQSNALEVAKRYGLPESIINYARFLKRQAKSQEDQLIDKLEKQLGETELKNAQLEQRLLDVQEKEKELKQLEKQLMIEKDQMKVKAEKEAEKYIDEAKAEADLILSNMRKMQETKKYHEVLEERQKLNRNQANVEEKEVVKKEGKHVFKVGETVELRNGGTVARILEVRKKDITIDLNGRKMHVKANQIRPSMRVIPKKKVNQSSARVSGGGLFSTMPTECNLIGMHVDEGIDTMMDYISDTKVHGLKTFRIIHGDGSGALRKAVHQRLKNMQDVESYRIGMPQEGGTGATVVKMK